MGAATDPLYNCYCNDQVEKNMIHSSGPIDLIYGSESPVNLVDVKRHISSAKKRQRPIEHLSFLGCQFNEGTSDVFRAVGKKLFNRKLKKGTDVKELEIKGVPDVGNDELSSLTPFLNDNSTLRSLDITGASFNTDKVCKHFRRNSSLESLVLGENECVGDEGVETIISALQIQADRRAERRKRQRRTGPGLSVLSVESCGITHEGAVSIASFVIDGGFSLRTLELSNNAIGDEGAKALVKSIEHGSQLGYLGLNNADIGDRGAAAFGEVLKSNTALHTLSLQNNKEITSVGASSLIKAVYNTVSVKAIEESNHVLKNLNLSGCTNIDPTVLKSWTELSARTRLLISEKDIIRSKVSSHLRTSAYGAALVGYDPELMPHILEFVAKSNNITSLFQTLKGTPALYTHADPEAYPQSKALTEKEAVHAEGETPSNGATFLEQLRLSSRRARKHYSIFTNLIPKRSCMLRLQDCRIRNKHESRGESTCSNNNDQNFASQNKTDASLARSFAQLRSYYLLLEQALLLWLFHARFALKRSACTFNKIVPQMSAVLFVLLCPQACGN